MTQHTQTIARINGALQGLRSAHGKCITAVDLEQISCEMKWIDRPSRIVPSAVDDLESVIAALESWRGFLETKGDQMTHDFLLGYESANFLVVRWS